MYIFRQRRSSRYVTHRHKLEIQNVLVSKRRMPLSSKIVNRCKFAREKGDPVAVPLDIAPESRTWRFSPGFWPAHRFRTQLVLHYFQILTWIPFLNTAQFQLVNLTQYFYSINSLQKKSLYLPYGTHWSRVWKSVRTRPAKGNIHTFTGEKCLIGRRFAMWLQSIKLNMAAIGYDSDLPR